ncbi:MAG: AbrB/MazE/SpoVT family DNA-binding domain-containing protein [Halobacteriaceae archaeon]
MVKVDSKGRIVLPKEVRENLGITPGTEVEIREVDGKAVVEPEDNPEQIIKHMEQLIKQASTDREETTPLEEAVDPVAQKHRDTIRNAAQTTNNE